jgi:hypothetical protein
MVHLFFSFDPFPMMSTFQKYPVSNKKDIWKLLYIYQQIRGVAPWSSG